MVVNIFGLQCNTSFCRFLILNHLYAGKTCVSETKPYLLDDINGIMELLPLQEGVQVVHQVEEVPLSAAVGDENRHALPRDAVWGLVHTLRHAFVFPLHVLEFQRGLKGQLQGSLYTEETNENESHDDQVSWFIKQEVRHVGPFLTVT